VSDAPPSDDTGAARPPGGTDRRGALREIAALFLRLGLTAFGGPAAHIAMLEDEVVRRRRWMSRARFLDLLGATNLIPGPNSTEMAIHVGRSRAGRAGLLLAGTCFILPATLIVLGFAWAYVRFGSLPRVAGVLYGVKPVIIAVVVQALWGLGRMAIKNGFLALLGVAAVVGSAAGLNELLVLFAAGLCAIAAAWLRRRLQDGGPGPLAPVALLPAALSRATPPSMATAPAAAHRMAPAAAGLAALAPAAALPVAFSLGRLFLFFLKVGSVLFGSGYVLLAFLRGDLVQRWHWLSEGQLLDAVAVGQITPGPVFTTATFIGYLLGGPAGALLATAGIFLPAFLFVAVSGPIVPRLRRSPLAGACLDGVNVASLALMAVVIWRLGCAALVDPATVLLAIAGAVALLAFRINSAWLVLGGALAGLLLGRP
jgi:chromate transporter